MRKLVLLFCFALGLWASDAYAQDLTVRGTVTNQLDGSTLPGVSVVIKGTSTGTSTDINGAYSIKAPQGAILQFSFIGMLDEEVTVGQNTTIDVAMIPDLKSLEEVVVTALGVKRELKSLGYAHQEIKGDVILESRETNVANALTGKIAGLQVLRSSNGPAGSSKIILRGNNSLSGDNQPLIVVDGMPMSNFTGRDNNDYWNPSLDMGSGMGDLNQEDIESISVLKGPSAAALYGSRAGNGVILITTKKGKKSNGLGITFNASYGTETPFTHPAMQTSFGQGNNGMMDQPTITSSWGPKIEGQTVTNWNGEQKALAAYNNVENYFGSGIAQNYNLTFQQEIDNISVYSSLTRRNDDSYIPGANLTKTNLTTRAFSRFGSDKRWTLDAKIQYMNTVAKNRPLLGHNANNPFYTLYLLPVSLDITEFADYLNDSGNINWYNANQINPYWTAENVQNKDNRDRFILYGSLKNQITNWLSAELSVGSDLYTTNMEEKRYAGSSIQPNGSFKTGKETFFENNFTGLISGKKDNLISKIGIDGKFGGNIMMREYSLVAVNAGELEVPNLFSVNNFIDSPVIDDDFYKMNMASLFGSLQFNWDSYLFIEGTLRNDWSSTLSEENRSYLYPSANLSFVVSEMLENIGVSIPSWFSYARLRASLASVGNSLRPYELYNTYSIGNNPLGHTTATMGEVLFNSELKNELISAKEVGADIRFFNNRLGFDFTWYKTNAINQLIGLPMDPMSGYNFRMINAGNIQNKGIELAMNARIIENLGGFSWNAAFNYSRNENLIIELTDSVKKYSLGGYDNLQIYAEVGDTYGAIYGNSFLRVEDENSPYFGQMIIADNGYPQVNNDPKLLGNQEPTALMGISNTFAYKGLSLSFLVDGRFGGEIFSQTNQAMQYVGTAEVTAPDGNREDIIVEGVIDNGDGTYSQNTIAITQQEYWTTIAGGIGGNLGVNEANIYDATNVRLRYINLSYTLPKSILKNTPFQKATIGATMTNVWLIKSYMNGVDPEAIYSTGLNATGFEAAAPPTSRSLLFNLSVNF